MSILCLSGSRADYGYILPVADALGEGVFDLSTMIEGRDTPESLATRAGIFGATVAERIARTKPRLLLVVGDRWEILSACQAAVLARVPIAHLGAGEVTTGSYDNRFRAAIEALATLPICLTHRAYARLEGAGVLAGCTSVQPPADVPAGDGTAILALYPETAGDDVAPLLGPVARLLRDLRLEVLTIGSNPDTGSGGFAGDSLPAEQFQARLAAATVIVGNSSAGIIEAPILCTPTVNIGKRQEGRPQAASVFQADATIDSIGEAIKHALAFGKQRVDSPYYRPGAAQTIAQGIRNYLEERNASHPA